MDEPLPNSQALSRAAVEIAPDVSRFMGSVLGGAEIEFSELLAEKVRAWRFSAQVKIVTKAKRQLEDAGLSPNAVPLRTLAPLLVSASWEDDESMQDRWASLLANAAGGRIPVPPSFPRILSEIEPIEAQILSDLYSVIMRFAPKLRPRFAVPRESMATNLEVHEDTLRVHLDNLVRLRLITRGTLVLNTSDDTHAVTLTALGQTFVRACMALAEPDPEIVFTEPPQGKVIWERDGSWRIAPDE